MVKQVDIPTLRGLLKTEPVRVTFEKKDGTTRVMFCTQNPDFIPKDEQPQSETKREKSKTLNTVWDLLIQEWRSFHDDQVIEYQLSELSADELTEAALG